MKKYVPKIVIVLLLTITACYGEITCYVCQTGGGLHADKCGDDFRLTSDKAVYCSGSCQKTRGFRTEGSRKVVEVTRGCVAYTSHEGCRDGNHNGISATICTCNTYICNSAIPVMPSTLMSLLLGCLVRILVFKVL